MANELSIEDDLNAAISRELLDTALTITNALKGDERIAGVTTPVDTGFAKNSWEMKIISDDEILIESTANYMEALNNGSSKQAPKKFVEKIIDTVVHKDG